MLRPPSWYPAARRERGSPGLPPWGTRPGGSPSAEPATRGVERVDHFLLYAIGLGALLSVVACSGRSNNRAPAAGDAPAVSQTPANALAADAPAADVPAADAPAAQDNILLAEWTGPSGGVPAFDRMDLASLKPALETGMARQLEQVEAIAQDPDPPTFQNTIVALERTGRDLDRVMAYWGIWRGNLSTPEFREIEKEMAPKLAEFQTRIIQNRPLFARIRAVHDGDTASLRPDQQRLVKLVYDDFARDGATLEGAAAERYAAIQKELAELYTRFANNVLADEEQYVLFLTKQQLAGLPDSFVQAAAAAAQERKHDGEYAITNTRSSVDPFLTYSAERSLREQVWRIFVNRGDNGDEHDNNALIAAILKLRFERVRLLGFADYATWCLEDRMAKTPARAMELMEAVWPAALARVQEEVADMQAIADTEGAGITLEPWDYRYYAEKVRRARYDLDSDEVMQYLQLDRLREAMFFVAGELFGFRFTPVPAGSVPVFHQDVAVWQVSDRDSDKPIGLWYLDPYARTGKRSGAWATTYRSHDTLDGERTVLAANNSNFVRGAPGDPVLVSWSDAETLFHEFGHALHSLSSRVDYPTLNGGVRDYIEVQSQLLEHWLLTDQVIQGYLVHFRTGEPMPAGLLAKIRKARTFNQGFETAEYLASALLDLKVHTIDPRGFDADAFERETLAALKLPREIVMRHRSPHFSHVFSGEGYAAGYYGYLWADVLTADAAEAFEQAPGGFYDRELARRLVDTLFAPRNAMDPADAYRAFRGRDARIDALMRDRGFPVPAAVAAP
ncbi:MAG: M3 family metallopeptidase [Deltaproteobacteria bacterium]|nr:M3 family metallopeptidase [Deltaproteobacteria bacterium]